MELVRALPKAELHLHIEGTLEPELMIQLAKRNNMLDKLPYKSVEDARAAYDFKSLQSFLDLYYAGCAVLITEQDFYDLTWAYLEKAAQDHVVHVELFFDPQTHTERGIAFATAINGVHKALKDAEAKLGVSGSIIICFLRHLGPEAALQCLQQALEHKELIGGVGLDSTEIGFPNELFKTAFAQAAAAGFPLWPMQAEMPAECLQHTIAHALAVRVNATGRPDYFSLPSEEGPPENVWMALDELKVQRIDHGIRSLEDAGLLRRLADTHMPLTLCPLSNLKLKVYEGQLEERLKELLGYDSLRITVNSDDPAYFGGYMEDNWRYLLEVVPLSDAQIFDLHANSFKASFLTQEQREAYLTQLQNCFDGHQRHTAA